MARVRRIAPVAGDLARRQLTRLSATWIAAVLATAVVSACSSAPEPKPLPDPPPSSSAPSSPSASASSSPEQTSAPTLPPEAKGTSAKAAKAFVRYYVQLINFATVTGSTQGLQSASGAGCKSCSDVVDRINSVYGAGGRIQSDGWRINSIKIVPGQPRSRPVIDVGIILSPQDVVKHNGAKAVHFKGGRLPATFRLRRVQNSWMVSSVGRAA